MTEPTTTPPDPPTPLRQEQPTVLQRQIITAYHALNAVWEARRNANEQVILAEAARNRVITTHKNYQRTLADLARAIDEIPF